MLVLVPNAVALELVSSSWHLRSEWQEVLVWLLWCLFVQLLLWRLVRLRLLLRQLWRRLLRLLRQLWLLRLSGLRLAFVLSLHVSCRLLWWGLLEACWLRLRLASMLSPRVSCRLL